MIVNSRRLSTALLSCCYTVHSTCGCSLVASVVCVVSVLSSPTAFSHLRGSVCVSFDGSVCVTPVMSS